jgi:triphosphatase
VDAAEQAPEPAPAGTLLAGFILDLAMPPEAAARLLRHPAIAARRIGRARSGAEDVIWLDSAEGSLAGQGLVLEQRRRAEPALRRSLPAADAPSLPGFSELAKAEPLDNRITETPVPFAALTGRRSLLQLAGEPPIELELLQGRLRAVADEQPIARLRIAGEPGAALALARLLATELPLLPAPDLAELGRALAQQASPRPRRKGAPAVARQASVETAAIGVIGHLLEVMLHQAPLCTQEKGPEGVHQLRVALRRLRSALKIFRPAIHCPEVEAFDQELRALANRLGPARDWDVFLGGLGAELAAALPEEKRCAQLLKAASARRAAAYAALRLVLDGPGFRLLVLDGITLAVLKPWRALAEPAPLLDLPAPEFGAHLLDRRWHKLCVQGEAIETLDAHGLHELRLACKRMRYAAELFAPLWPGKPARRLLKRLAAVQDALGLANDMSVARRLVASLASGTPAAPPWAVGLAEGFALGRLGSTRSKGLESWRKLNDTRAFWDVV